MPTRKKAGKKAESYEHEGEAVLRPEVGTQPQFGKKKPPKTYRYDSSLSPALDWDGKNPARELGEWLLAQIEEAASLGPPHLFSTWTHRMTSTTLIAASPPGGSTDVAIMSSTWGR